MNKRKAGLVGMVAGLATMGATGAAQAASHPGETGVRLMQPSSYAELLQPIPNAVAMLRAGAAEQSEAGIVRVQYDGNPHHHHHHAPPPPPHHHHRPVHHHHHRVNHHHNHHHQVNHHHHHNGATIVLPGVGVVHTGG